VNATRDKRTAALISGLGRQLTRGVARNLDGELQVIGRARRGDGAMGVQWRGGRSNWGAEKADWGAGPLVVVVSQVVKAC
jgi:hypothetical protein